MSAVWFKYRERGARYFIPVINAKLSVGDIKSATVPFLVDSGATLSFAPSFYIAGLVSIDPTHRKNSRCKNASGGEIWGVPLTVTVHVDGLPSSEQEIWFTDDSAPWGLLGQYGWFERFGVKFHNFPSSQRGRKFCLFEPKFH